MTLYYSDEQIALHHGDALEVAHTLPDGAADCIVTSPPYFGLRDYGIDGQYGLESSPSLYVARMRRLFSELFRVLADDGTLWLNIGDNYASGAKGSGGPPRLDGGDPVGARFNSRKFACGMPEKNLLGIPWRVAFALQDDGWILRNAVIWHKPNAMPESVTDRLSGRYEHVFLFSKSRRYWFDLDVIREDRAESSLARAHIARKPSSKELESVKRGDRGAFTPASTYAPDHGRNPGDVWTIPTQPFAAAHFAVYPVALPQRCILAGCKPGGTVLDPFSGSGTTGLAAQRTGRRYIGIDLNAEYLELSLNTRLREAALDFTEEVS